MNLEQLYELIGKRFVDRPKGSYVVSLQDSGLNRIAQKVGEEAIEVVIASLGDDRDREVSELADLFFHTLVLMAFTNIQLEDVFFELERRNRPSKNLE